MKKIRAIVVLSFLFALPAMAAVKVDSAGVVSEAKGGHRIRFTITPTAETQDLMKSGEGALRFAINLIPSKQVGAKTLYSPLSFFYRSPLIERPALPFKIDLAAEDFRADSRADIVRDINPKDLLGFRILYCKQKEGCEMPLGVTNEIKAIEGDKVLFVDRVKITADKQEKHTISRMMAFQQRYISSQNFDEACLDKDTFTSGAITFKDKALFRTGKFFLGILRNRMVRNHFQDRISGGVLIPDVKDLPLYMIPLTQDVQKFSVKTQDILNPAFEGRVAFGIYECSHSMDNPNRCAYKMEGSVGEAHQGGLWWFPCGSKDLNLTFE